MNQCQGSLRTCHDSTQLSESSSNRESIEFYRQRSYLNGLGRSLTSHYLWPVRACCFVQWLPIGIYMMMMAMISHGSWTHIAWPAWRINFGCLQPIANPARWGTQKTTPANGFTAFRWRMREEQEERWGAERRGGAEFRPGSHSQPGCGQRPTSSAICWRCCYLGYAAPSTWLTQRESQASFTIQPPAPEQAEEAVLLLTRPKRLRSGSGEIQNEKER